MKKRLVLSLAVTAALAAIPVYAAPAPADYSIVINGTQLEGEYGTLTENNRTLVQFRDVAEALGADVNWDAETKTVGCVLDGNEVSLQIGSSTMQSASGEITLDVPAQIVDGATYVPLRAISEGLGAQVDWDAQTKTITVDYAAEDTSEENIFDETDGSNITKNVDTTNYSMTSCENPIRSGSKIIMPVTAEYPVFKGNGRAATTINSYIADDAKSRVNSFTMSNKNRLYSLYQQCIKDGTRSMFNDYAYNLSYEVVNDSDGIISLYVTETILSDNTDKTTVWGLTLSTATGSVLTCEDIIAGSEDDVKSAMIEDGYSSLDVNRLSLSEDGFYVEDNKLVFVVNAGVLEDEIIEYVGDIPETVRETLPSASTVSVETAEIADTQLSQDNTIVLKLSSEYPVFKPDTGNLAQLNAAIASAQEKTLAAYKEQVKKSVLAAYKTFTDTKDENNKHFEPWLWTTKYKLVYNDNQKASVVVSTYIFTNDGNDGTTYSAYTCDLKTGKIISIDSLISDKAATDSKAKAEFERLIEANRLNFYTDVYERFDISNAVKYLSEDGITYMFNPGELASVSKGVIEVTVPLE